MPQLVKQINEQSTNMRSIQILIRHDHDRSIPQILGVCVLLSRHKTENLLEFGNLLGLLNLGVRCVLDIQNLALERVDSECLSLLLRQTRQRHCLC